MDGIQWLTASQEWEYAKVRQDAQLERIERGVGTLGDMAKGMQVRSGWDPETLICRITTPCNWKALLMCLAHVPHSVRLTDLCVHVHVPERRRSWTSRTL